jgi:hypothetical protein
MQINGKDVITIGNDIYIVKRKFTHDSWFGRAVEKIPREEILKAYHVENIFKDSNNVYYLVDKVDEAKII